ncbi:methyltransferase, HemK family [Hyphomonas neptunium ATCC 15444]|uniref:Release factor glutamine methyltransferase n=1 Tax=Hyphomonas neptunium (strain ATCC 15444) TaxID=228405 RepID=Q0C4I5_HYPNA|nr:methyltransferase, HemK family [Hyphomonas neptunium ATCC 15444]
MTPPTYDDLIRHAARRFKDAGLSEAYQNAVLLMVHAFGDTRAVLISAGNAPVPKAVEDLYLAAVERRAAREPIQHILGVTQFYGLDIRTDARALIPRIDSECVVEAALDRMPKNTPLVLADLGTGSGCLLAALLSQRPLARGEGVEASAEAASLARENLDALNLAARGAVFDGSWTQWQGWENADLIISNPPYIASAEIAVLEPEVRAHDPLSALDGGADGLDAYREIIALAAARMKPGAWLVFEIGHDQKAALEWLMAQTGFEAIASGQDLGGNDRWVGARRPC